MAGGASGLAERPGREVAPDAALLAELRRRAVQPPVDLSQGLAGLCRPAAAGEERGVPAKPLESGQATGRPLVGGVRLGHAAQPLIGAAQTEGGLGAAALLFVVAETFEDRQGIGMAAQFD